MKDSSNLAVLFGRLQAALLVPETRPQAKLALGGAASAVAQLCGQEEATRILNVDLGLSEDEILSMLETVTDLVNAPAAASSLQPVLDVEGRSE